MRRDTDRNDSLNSDAQGIVDLLILRLSQRGLLFDQIPRFIKDVMLVIKESESGFVTPAALNGRLDFLGWGKQILDEFTLQLILFLADSPEGSPAHVLH